VLGCGGTIARLSSERWAVHVVIMAEGATSRDPKRNAASRRRDVEDLQRAARRANADLGAATVELFGLPDNRMDSLELLDVVKVVESALSRHRPSLVFTHHGGDVNVDHLMVHDAVVTACRSLPGATTRELLFFEVPSSTEWRPPASRRSFEPNLYYDIGSSLGQKLRALSRYQSEMREFPHPRSMRAVESLATWRGASCGATAAEAFCVGRIVR
jgi:LmbE family N-acetylglucosaminyl deacetylase